MPKKSGKEAWDEIRAYRHPRFFLPDESADHSNYNYNDNTVLLDGIGALPHGDEVYVLVVSDHGAKRMDGGICINEWLIREGLLALKPGVATPTRPAGSTRSGSEGT